MSRRLRCAVCRGLAVYPPAQPKRAVQGPKCEANPCTGCYSPGTVNGEIHRGAHKSAGARPLWRFPFLRVTRNVRRFNDYLEAAPVRRRLRLAIIIIAVATICWLWIPAIISAHGRSWPSVTQAEVNKACLSGANVFNAELLCPDGKPVVARDYNIAKAAETRSDVAADLRRPVSPSFLLLVAFVVAWILVPLLERRA
jgi:hypothetical protein